MKASLLASAVSPFAHLIGRTPAAAAPVPPAAKANDGDPNKPGAEPEDDMTDDEKRKKRNRDAGRDEEDDGEDGKEGKKASKKKAKAEGDDMSDDEDNGDADARAVRLRERGRCAAIFADAAAASRPDMAAQLAFATDMNRTQAITTLRAIAAGERDPSPAARAGVAARMASVTNPDLGAPAVTQNGTDPAKATADAIIAAGKRRRGEA